MDFEEVACVCALLISARKKRKRKRQFWVHPNLSQRLFRGEFYSLYSDLRMHPNKFFSYFRMSSDTFDELMTLLGPELTFQNTNMRKCVPPEERLAVTLRYLATGNSFSSLHFEYLLGTSTIREIVRDTCDTIWKYLQATHMPEKSEDGWIKVADDFYNVTQFPNCIGAVGGKHIRIKKSDESGSHFFSYKNCFSIVLMAVVDANNCFIAVDVDAFGKSSDSNVFKNSNIGRKLEANQLRLPLNRRLPNDDNGSYMPFVIVGDEAFALSEHVLRPYTNRNLSIQQRVFNYRLSRVRQIVECTFGIMANKWRIFHRPLDVKPDFCDRIIKACCILHNFVNKKDGVLFEDTLYESPMDSVQPAGTRGNTRGKATRDYFSTHFTSPQGEISWQYDKI